VKLLLDTHIILWNALEPWKLPNRAEALIADETAQVAFSVVNLWEIAIKLSSKHPNLVVGPHALRRELIANDFEEFKVAADHVLAMMTLPLLYCVPFDRLLIAQAITESCTLITVDKAVSRYLGPIKHV
jgi:PIN domain nuclease of toxin-antitoxin system